jgi:hypothetical protein
MSLSLRGVLWVDAVIRVLLVLNMGNHEEWQRV